MQLITTRNKEISFAELKKAISSGNGLELIRPGDKFAIELKNGELVNAVCGGYVNEKRARFVLEDCLAEKWRMNDTPTNKGGYIKSEGRRHVLEDIKCGLSDIMPLECGCEAMISLYRSHAVSRWEEDESITPQPGDVVFYDWQDSGSGDDRGAADHVGIVSSVSGRVLKVIEGNFSNSVKERTLEVNGKYLRGFGLPAYYTKTDNKEDFDMDINEARKQLTSCADTGDTPSAWAKEAAEYCKRKGIFNGDGAGNFGWQQPITREAVACIIYRALEAAGALGNLSDV